MDSVLALGCLTLILRIVHHAMTDRTDQRPETRKHTKSLLDKPDMMNGAGRFQRALDSETVIGRVDHAT